MLNFTPDGLGGSFFGTFAPYMPEPPSGAPSPLLWGDEGHVARLFGDNVAALRTTRASYVEHASSPDAYRELFGETFGPLVALRAALADRPERRAALDRDFRAFTESANVATDGSAAFEYEYLLVVAERA
jgi:hypothetical protein